MKKMIRTSILTGCLLLALSSVAQAQLPSEKAVQDILKLEIKAKLDASQPAAGAMELPSEGGNIPKGAKWGGGSLPSSGGFPFLSVAEKRKLLPSNAANPLTTIKKKSGVK
jgi:hypothetical protein